ncbi:MAG: response regulator [Lachnospiraceae bacterium]
MKLLIIEDEPALQKALVKGFQRLGYAVEAAGDGEQALDLYYGNQYNLVILDLNLPIFDGLDVLNEIRGENKEIPVMILSARSEVGDKITGLDKGANESRQAILMLKQKTQFWRYWLNWHMRRTNV